MCIVSMVVGHFQDQYPSPSLFPQQLYHDYWELKRKAELYDKMMQQPDCPDPAKVKWANELEQFMREKYGLVPKPQPLGQQIQQSLGGPLQYPNPLGRRS